MTPRPPASARPTTAAPNPNNLGSVFDRLARGDQGAHFLGRARRAEQIALHLRTAERMDGRALLLGLDAFGGRNHVAVGGYRDHCLDDRGAACQLVHEAAV